MNDQVNSDDIEEHLSEDMPLTQASQKLRLDQHTLASMATDSVLVLPSNGALQDTNQDALFFQGESKELLITLQQAQIAAKFYDDGRPKRSVDFRSADIILPPLLFVGQKILEGGLVALGGWIVNKWLKEPRPKTKPPTLKVQYLLLKDGVVKWVTITGPAKKVADALRGLNAKHDGSDPPRKRIG